MRTSDQGIAFLVAHEGVVPAPYLDSKSVWTFGIGHTAAAGPPTPADMAKGMPPDLDEALAYAFATFRRDLAKYEDAVLRVLNGLPVPQHEFDAAVSFHFNTGAIARASWVKEWIAGRKASAAKLMMQWRRPPEIIKRREAERDLFLHKNYGAKTAAVWTVGPNNRPVWKPVRVLTTAQVVNLVRPAPPPPKPVVLPRPVDPIPTIKPLPSDTPSSIVGWGLTIVAVIIAVLIASNGG